MVAGLSACETMDNIFEDVAGIFDDTPRSSSRQTAQTRQSGQSAPRGAFPNLGNVPERPPTTVEERRAALQRGLMTDAPAPGGAYSQDDLRAGGTGTAAGAPAQIADATQPVAPVPPPVAAEALQPAAPSASAVRPAFPGLGGAVPPRSSRGAQAPTAMPTVPSAPQPARPQVAALPPVPPAPTGPLVNADRIAAGTSVMAQASGPIALPPGTSADPYTAYYGQRLSQPVSGARPPQLANPTQAPLGAPVSMPVPPTPQAVVAQPVVAPQVIAGANVPPPAAPPQVASLPQPMTAAPLEMQRPASVAPPIMNRREVAPSAMQAMPPMAPHGTLPGQGVFPGAPMGQPAMVQSAPQQAVASAQPAGPVAPSGQRLGIIYFGDGSAQLTASDRQVLKQMAAIHRQQGGALTVIGHASHAAKASKASAAELVNYRVSGERADAVARELMRLGVPRDAVRLGAVGDNMPEYDESRKTGEAGNRRVEVFLGT